MRATNTIGEWMDRVERWEQTCEHSDPHTACEICAGALHPVLSATVRHLQKLLEDKTSRVNIRSRFELAMDTDEWFEEVRGTLADLIEVEGADESNEIVAREIRDIRIIARDVRALVQRFEQLFPDIREHPIATGVRQLAM